MFPSSLLPLLARGFHALASGLHVPVLHRVLTAFLVMPSVGAIYCSRNLFADFFYFLCNFLFFVFLTSLLCWPFFLLWTYIVFPFPFDHWWYCLVSSADYWWSCSKPFRVLFHLQKIPFITTYFDGFGLLDEPSHLFDKFSTVFKKTLSHLFFIFLYPTFNRKKEKKKRVAIWDA